MRASTAVAPPPPPVSGERVSIRVHQPPAKGGGVAREAADGRASGAIPCPACFELSLSYWPFFHSPNHIANSSSCLSRLLLRWAGGSWVLNSRTKPLLIHDQSVFQSIHIIPVSVLGGISWNTRSHSRVGQREKCHQKSRETWEVLQQLGIPQICPIPQATLISSKIPGESLGRRIRESRPS